MDFRKEAGGYRQGQILAIENVYDRFRPTYADIIEYEGELYLKGILGGAVCPLVRIGTLPYNQCHIYPQQEGSRDILIAILIAEGEAMHQSAWKEFCDEHSNMVLVGDSIVMSRASKV